MNVIKKLLGLGAVMVTGTAMVSCGGDTVPKPEAYLRLDYPMGKYVPYNGDCPYTFGYNSAGLRQWPL